MANEISRTSIALGAILFIIGIVAIVAAAWTTLATTLVIGVVLLIGGLAILTDSFLTKKEGGFALKFLSGLLALIIGVLMLYNPIAGVLTLSVLLMAFFLVEGIFRMVSAFQMRPHAEWGWVFFSGILSLLMGILIGALWPISAMWVIGLLVGINVMFAGWTMLMVGMKAKKIGE